MKMRPQDYDSNQLVFYLGLAVKLRDQRGTKLLDSFIERMADELCRRESTGTL